MSSFPYDKTWTNQDAAVTVNEQAATALLLLADPVLDALISGETPFADLPAAYGQILSAPETLCHRIRY